MRKFSEFATEESQFEGDKVKIDDLLNKEIVVSDYKIGKSKYEGKGNYLTIQVKIENQLKVIFTGSEVLIKQCEKYQEEMPFMAIIKKVDRYYSFS